MNDDNQIILRKLLKDYRINSRLKQNEVAKLLNKPQSYVSKYESGEKNLSFYEVYLICKTLGLSLVDFSEKYENALSAEK